MPASEPSRLIRFGRAIASVAAMLGIAAVALLLLTFYVVHGYSAGIYGSAVLLGGSAYLLIRKRWIGMAMGGFCWLVITTGPFNVWYPLMPPFGLILIMVACVVLEQLRGFPLSKLQSAGLLCSLAVVAALTFRPYLLARFGGPSANLRHAVLILADLWDADLRGADLTGADLRGAGLGGANLLRADLRRAKLSSALYDRCTRWPEDFDPQSHGAHLAGWIDCIPTDD